MIKKIGEINGRLLDENEENMDLDSSHDHPSIGRDLHLAQNLIHQSHPRYALIIQKLLFIYIRSLLLYP